MASRQLRRLKAVALFGVCVALFLLILNFWVPAVGGEVSRSSLRQGLLKNAHPGDRALEALNLDESQCDARFPGLTEDIDRMVALGPFKLKQARDQGPLQARIKDGQVHGTLGRSLVLGDTKAG